MRHDRYAVELFAISRSLMDDGLVPVLAKLIPCQHPVLQIKALELAGHVGRRLTRRFIGVFILGDWTLAMVAELRSMHPAVRLSAAKACVVILPIASFNDHLTACFDLVFDAFCAETDPPILLELMKVVMSENCRNQLYDRMDAIVHKMGLLIGSPNIQVNDILVVDAGLRSLTWIYEDINTPKIMDQFKTMNILDVLSRLLVEYPDDTQVRHAVLKLGHHIASDMNYPPLSGAFRGAIGKLVESIANENLNIAQEAMLTAHSILTTSKVKREWILLLESSDVARHLCTILTRNIQDLSFVSNLFSFVFALLNGAKYFPSSKLRTNMEEYGVVGLLQTIQKREDAEPCLVDDINQFAMKYFPHLSDTFSSSFIPYEANSDLSLSAAIPGSVMPNPRTLVELRYLEFIGSLLAKSNWWEKIHDELISSRWRSEALAQDVSEAIIDLAFDQLRSFCQHYIHKASHGSAIISPGAVERTFVMDHGVPASVYKSLIHGVAILEDVPDYKKDWHPGTDSMQNQSVAVIPTFDCSSEFSSRRSQWLPSEFYVDKDGHVSINSYINNLNPVWHPDLYKTIASVFECFVPMLENLAGTMRSKSEYIRIDNLSEGYSQLSGRNLYDDLSVTIARPVHVPRMPKSFGGPDTLPLPISLRGRHLQVIVKLASIHLTPDKPRYNGGSWRIEGTTNESIVATCLYYYEMENITSSKLSFRQAVGNDFVYKQPSDRYYKDVYGITNRRTWTNQHLGSLDALPSRCIVFPNMLQHKVMPFELADPSKPGVRKILAFFLIDPSKRIVSTAHIPPQQPDWYTACLNDTPIPAELWDDIIKYIPGTMSLEEARSIRLELMQERSAFADMLNEDVFENLFNLNAH
ncbi:hypothetical protein BASA50_006604 [Batrachochytrium salamandrivorans]|uniref:Uncharacterized protein n=1 Tax=Batrachochytrium salamandrivorans TaxID=1357716 RepID=A0ABQ8FC97_9FUNG|nr:hypothetical protein BASA50_006604 [Batrachochytrium salamandrivorans]